MKHIYLALALCSAVQLSVRVSAQSSVTDNSANYHHLPLNASSPGIPRGGSVCGPPLTVSVSPICDSGSVTLTATGAASYSWFTTASGGTPIGSGSSFTTPVINSSTDFYVAALCPDSTSMPLPAQAGSYSGNIRGYFFTAPINFTITGVRVPEDAATGNQTVEILRFNAGTPPAYPGLTNDFVSLAYFNSVASTGIVSTNITVNVGDVIGVYGWRGATNSYSSGGSFVSDIGGFPVTLERTGMQYDLDAMQMFDVWSEPGGAISRTEIYYKYDADTSVHVLNPVQVNHSALTSASAQICDGDSILLAGQFRLDSGTYNDTLSTSTGCDSIISTTLTVNNLPVVSIAAFAQGSVCIDNSALPLPAGSPAGGTYSGTGVSGTDFDPAAAGSGTHTITYYYEDANTCAASASTTLAVNALPVVTMASFSPSTVCIGNSPIALPVGAPSGGTYSGSGVNTTDFDPSVAGEGTHTITYYYEDANLCAASDSTAITVDLCTGITTLDSELMTVYPNPASDLLNINGDLRGAEIQLTELSGKIILSERMLSDTYQVNLKQNELAAGMYLVKLVNRGQVISAKKIVVQ